MAYSAENYNIKYLQSEVWFSDIDINPDDLMDEIVLNEYIYNDLDCGSGEIMTFDQVYFF